MCIREERIKTRDEEKELLRAINNYIEARIKTGIEEKLKAKHFSDCSPCKKTKHCFVFDILDCPQKGWQDNPDNDS